MEKAAKTAMEVNATADDTHGWIYWFFTNTLRALKNFVLRHKKFFFLLGFVTLVLLVLFRPLVHPHMIWVRIHILEITASAIALFLGWRFLVRHKWKAFALLVLVTATVVGTIKYSGVSPRQYLALYLRYNDLPIEELQKLPTTQHERIHPLNSIRVLSQEAMAETEQASDPDFVRDGDSYRWTMAIEPEKEYTLQRISGKVKKVINVSVSAPSPNFSEENRIPVDFAVGESLLWSRNSRTATVRTFGPIRFLLYEPVDVKYIKDDKGGMVQIVTLIRWKGFLFLRPEFGGVQIIRQGTTGLVQGVKRFFVGEGEWVRPRDLKQHPFLVGQNLVPEPVSRFAAESFRFQAGFFAPTPGYHKGDVRIPDLPEDQNNQPFTASFRFDESGGFERNKAYHYYALEPYQRDKQGLNTSIFYPADGIGSIYTFQHYRKGEALTGVSAISAKVISSRKEYDWSVNHPVEHRPYIKEIDGKTRFFWLTTVVTKKSLDHSKNSVMDGSMPVPTGTPGTTLAPSENEAKGQKTSMAGDTPEVVLTDALYKIPVWVDSRKPETWVDKLRADLSSVWKE